MNPRRLHRKSLSPVLYVDLSAQLASQPQSPHRPQSGFALLLVFLMAAMLALSLYLQIPRVAFQAQRQKEQLLIERGEQYQRAIQLFVRVNGRYPAKIEDLENYNNRRFLRHKFVDPMTGKAEWRLIHVNAAGVFYDSIANKNKDKDKNKDSASQNTFVGEQAFLNTEDTQGKQSVNAATRRRESEGGAAPVDANGQPLFGAPPPGAAVNGTALPPVPNALDSASAGQLNGQPAPPGGLPGQPNPQVPNQIPQQLVPGMPVLPGQLQAANPNQPNSPGQPPAPFPGAPQQGAIPQPGLQPGFPQQAGGIVQQPGGFVQQPGGFAQPGNQSNSANQAGASASSFVGGGSSFVGSSSSFVGGDSFVGSSSAGSTSTPTGSNPFSPTNTSQPNNFQSNNFQSNQPNSYQPNQPYQPPTQPNQPTSASAAAAGFQQNPAAQGAAANMINNILTSPRPGGFPGAQGSQGGQSTTGGSTTAGATSGPGGAQIGAGIAGVASTAETPAIMVYNDQKNYNEWEFIFDVTKQKQQANPNGGVPGTPAQAIGSPAGPATQTAPGGLPGGLSFGSQPGGTSSSPFGASAGSTLGSSSPSGPGTATSNSGTSGPNQPGAPGQQQQQQSPIPPGFRFGRP